MLDSWAAPYRNHLGQVATRTFVPTTQGNSSSTFITRTTHFMRVPDCTEIKIAVPNWFVNANNGASTLETNCTGSITLLAVLEYPSGKFTNFTFGGSSSKVVASGVTQWSDFCPAAIRYGDTFWIRLSITNTATGGGPPFGGVGPCPPMNTSLGDALSQTSNLTAATITDGGFGGTLYPAAIVGRTNYPSVVIVGDSRAPGIADTPDATGNTGEMMRGLGANYPIMNLACPGEFGRIFASSAPLRQALMKYASIVVCSYGINDIDAGDSAATVKSTIQSIAALARPRRFYQSTISPNASSTDGFVTTVNQTPQNNTTISAVNDAIRGSSIVGVDGFFEVANIMSPVQDDGIWNVTGGNWTSDGLHGNSRANTHVSFLPNVTGPVGVGFMPTSTP